jgi:hypothetical protein
VVEVRGRRGLYYELTHTKAELKQEEWPEKREDARQVSMRSPTEKESTHERVAMEACTIT